MKHYLILLVLIKIVSALYRRQDSYHYHENDFNKTYERFLSNFIQSSLMVDEDKVFNFDYVGTHDSGSYKSNLMFVQTQAVSIYKQLTYGIRFLDIRIRSINNKLAIHHGSVFLNLMFGDVMQQIVKFLHKHPTEFIFLSLREEHIAFNSSLTICQILNTYFQGTDVVYRGTITPKVTVGHVRGKIILMSSHLPCRHMFYGCSHQNHWNLKTNWDLYDKWLKIKEFALTFKKNNVICGLNYLSGSSSNLLVRPEFVVSGHIFSSSYAPRLSTGLVYPLFKLFPDFPKVNCFIGLCTIAFEGTNILHDKFLGQIPTKRGAYIVITDFFGIAQPLNAIKLNRQKHFI